MRTLEGQIKNPHSYFLRVISIEEDQVRKSTLSLFLTDHTFTQHSHK